MSKKATTLLAVMVVWAIVLVGVDRAFNPPPAVYKPVAGGTHPHVEIGIKHFCCTGCNDSAFKAISKFSWLGQPKLLNKTLPSVDDQKAKGKEMTKVDAYSGTVVADLNPEQLTQVDFVALDRAIRDEGLVPFEMKVKGFSNFTLVASLPHICCPACVGALEAKFNPKAPEGGGGSAFTMLGLQGQPKVSEVSKEVETNHTLEADVYELFRALEESGFAPSKLHMSVPK